MHSFMQLQRHRVMDRLLSHGQVRALVFGAHGEGSPDVHHCIEASARQRARQMWRGFGVRSAH